MVKVEILVGSPRKNGNTAYMAKHLHKTALLSGMSARITFLYDYTIQACTDCRGCKNGEMNCVFHDQAAEIYARIEKADLLVFGTPIYWFGPSATMKLLIDRLRPYFQNKKLLGKKAGLLLSAGEGAKDCDLAIEMYKRIFNTLGIKYIGAVSATAFDIGDVELDKTVPDLINRLLANFVKV